MRSRRKGFFSLTSRCSFSLNVQVFLEPWTLTLAVHCACGRERVAPLPELARTELQDLEQRTLGKLVRRLSCQDCGQRPASVIAEHVPSREREGMVV